MASIQKTVRNMKNILSSLSSDEELDLELGDLQTLDQLKQTLSAGGGLNVKIDTASSRDGKVETRLKIESAGAGA